jgi:hypothetical protein
MTSPRAILAVVATLASASQPAMSQSTFYARDNFVKDLSRGLEWMRCSVGQRWSLESETCAGKALQLNHDEIAQVIPQANEQLGPGWRLPNTEELESLLCEECAPPKIDPELFPQTEAMPYWTGEKNFNSPKNFWSVNFRTGFRYGRFFPYQQQMVRLVRDRRAGEVIED